MRARLRTAWARLRAVLGPVLEALVLVAVCTLPWLGLALAWRGEVYGWALAWGCLGAAIVHGRAAQQGGMAEQLGKVAEALQQLARRQG